MLVFVFLASMPVYAQAQRSSALDSVEVGLITCSPHDEVYSLYGHTALHCRDLRTGRDYVFNYGVFDYKKPHFVWRFIMGQTDYMLECISDLQAFCSYYKRWGSQVKEQILDLTPTEKARLVSALGVNLQNPVYRYNYFYDNCSTRPRDMIERCLEGTVSYAAREGFEDATYRQLIHLCTEEHPWAELGNDLLLGFHADRKTTQRERHFLPVGLRPRHRHSSGRSPSAGIAPGDSHPPRQPAGEARVPVVAPRVYINVYYSIIGRPGIRAALWRHTCLVGRSAHARYGAGWHLAFPDAVL